ncbi:hypothetical protein LshimejAT787_0206150 [Lyophyllum shimeji]|uniref:Uncharacterized protein n=1 Tax=Lyophyllum shimeji TaxID=47721 RepID=A0A9P3UKZ4_LYOSH|nr:hypothetical protein LshimejAT787_0206150 [Lyophyllum shimeji]
MQSFLQVLRYIVFGLFIICNAIVTSVAVWNRSLGEAVGWTPQVDIYLIFVGCLGLTHVFTVIFIELAYRHGITGRVWFECLWVGLFWLLYLAGASAVTSIAPNRMCDLQIRILINDTCVSTHVLLAFTWIMTIILLSYFALLMTASLVHLKHDSRIFHCYVHKFPWADLRRALPSAPASPSIPSFLKKMPSIIAPRPQRPVPTALYSRPRGLGSEYEIESYATPVPDVHGPTAPSFPTPPIPVVHTSPDIHQPEELTPPSLYPQHVQSALTLGPRQLQPPRPQTQHRQLRLHHPPPEPPPLGNWPRRYPTSLPPARTRNTPALTIPAAAATVTRNDSFPPRPRPSGPRRRLVMQNPYLVVRFVTFALLVNLNLLILACAAWNVNATVSAGLPVSVTIIISILNSCALFFCVILGLADLIVPDANTARVAAECAWSAVLSVFHTGTAISVTVNGQAICRLTSNGDLCASASLLIPTAWLSSMILFSHFFTLFISAMVHVPRFPDVWKKDIYSIDWFSLRDGCKHGNISDSEIDSWARYVKDIEAAAPRADTSTKAPWARNIRRGIDAPFKSNPTSATTSPSTTLTSLPIAPLRVQSRTTAGSRFLEKFRESSRLSRSESLSQFATEVATPAEPFPSKVANHDLPIPLPRFSEWIRADTIKGINVHTIPTSP